MVIAFAFSFTFLWSLIGQKKLVPLSEQKQNQSQLAHPYFSRSWCWLGAIALNSDWPIALFQCVVIGWSNNYYCIGFGYMTLN